MSGVYPMGRALPCLPRRQRRPDTDIEIRQVKYLNNIVEQDHRAIKRMVRAILGLKAFWSVAITITGIEIMHMIRKSQLRSLGTLWPAQQFYSLAA
jgi:putative transposase